MSITESGGRLSLRVKQVLDSRVGTASTIECRPEYPIPVEAPISGIVGTVVRQSSPLETIEYPYRVTRLAPAYEKFGLKQSD